MLDVKTQADPIIANKYSGARIHLWTLNTSSYTFALLFGSILIIYELRKKWDRCKRLIFHIFSVFCNELNCFNIMNMGSGIGMAIAECWEIYKCISDKDAGIANEWYSFHNEIDRSIERKSMQNKRENYYYGMLLTAWIIM